MRSLLHAKGYRYRLHGVSRGSKLPGNPDLVFAGRRKVIFINGCFWHFHDCRVGQHASKANAEFWETKRTKTRNRDADQRRQLEGAGWEVLTVWECELKDLTAPRNSWSGSSPPVERGAAAASALFGRQPVTDAADGLEPAGVLSGITEFLAKVTHVHLDGPLVSLADVTSDVVGFVPQTAHQIRLGADHAVRLQQRMQQVEFGSGQAEFVAVHGHGTGLITQIKPVVAVAFRIAAPAKAAPESSASSDVDRGRRIMAATRARSSLGRKGFVR